MASKGAVLAAVLICLAWDGAARAVSYQVQNQLEASRDTEIDLDIVENWFDLNVYGDLRDASWQIGLRHSGYPDPDPTATSTGLAGIESTNSLSHRYLELQYQSTLLRVGTFTRLVGNGLLFRSWESRDLRVDTNLEGLLAEQDGGWWRASAFTGRTETGQLEDPDRERQDRFSGADLSLIRDRYSLGGGAILVDREGEEAAPLALGLRGGIGLDNTQIDVEAARLDPDDGAETGTGLTVEATTYAGDYTLYAGFKRYERMALYTGDQKLMNQPPVLLHQHAITLLTRHPHQLDPDDEIGFIASLSWTNGAGNWLVSAAETKHIDGELGRNSFQEAFVEWDRDEVWGFDLMHAVVDLQKVPFGEEWEYFFSTALELRRGVGSGAVGFLWEHQQKDSDHVGTYADELLTLEYEAEAGWTLSLIGEVVGWSERQWDLEPKDPLHLDSEYRQTWSGVQLATTIGEHHELRLFGGSRRAGTICIGGVCRFEPAFDGVELSWVARY